MSSTNEIWLALITPEPCNEKDESRNKAFLMLSSSTFNARGKRRLRWINNHFLFLLHTGGNKWTWGRIPPPSRTIFHSNCFPLNSESRISLYVKPERVALVRRRSHPLESPSAYIYRWFRVLCFAHWSVGNGILKERIHVAEEMFLCSATEGSVLNLDFKTEPWGVAFHLFVYLGGHKLSNQVKIYQVRKFNLLIEICKVI